MSGQANIFEDLRAEGEQLYTFLKTLKEEDWSKTTTFKSWTINDVVEHLHFSDYMAVTSHKGEDDFKAMMAEMMDPKLKKGEFSKKVTGNTSGVELLERWKVLFEDMCDRFVATEPSRRLPWFGPDMGISMFATARLMETWSHSWAIYDVIGVPKVSTDVIKNIVTIGVKTYGWTFVNRKETAPEPKPYVKLTAPSGEVWDWNEPQADNMVEGDAVEFCQVVTQVRNIADVNLTVTGGPANQWMDIAQCFAGPPNDPPVPGSRLK
ncbi:MAG: TIGR03084 family protein [Pseudomonadales bacterium]|nr:TIGR03084 family protein [Pseudomonadales bacterium]